MAASLLSSEAKLRISFTRSCSARVSHALVSSSPTLGSRTMYSERTGLESSAHQARTSDTGVVECDLTALGVSHRPASRRQDEIPTEVQDGHLGRGPVPSRDDIPTGNLGQDVRPIFGGHQQRLVVPALLLLDAGNGRAGHARQRGDHAAEFADVKGRVPFRPLVSFVHEEAALAVPEQIFFRRWFAWHLSVGGDMRGGGGVSYHWHRGIILVDEGMQICIQGRHSDAG